ncbi:hypothetical protein HCH_00142 [Hahella chejuensis KCTC 2396]|uniref:Uncharacterized protein n=1 Tax=Hahella chejuensis (strain KCTC 2396) TaxID=349521 RepID=Q2SQL3_HAHCH|nr:hypothetical protein HCH_00142 [Hahella chejuensis KCTC 2396]
MLWFSISGAISIDPEHKLFNFSPGNHCNFIATHTL